MRVVNDRSALSGVDANLLVALDALLVERSVERAARRIGLSASAMSHTLSRIRQLIEDPILVRAGGRMVVTPRATQLAPLVHEGIALLGRVMARPLVFDPAKEKSTLRLAAVDFAHYVLRQFFPILRREAPLVDVTIAPFTSASIQDLVDGNVDIAFAATGRPIKKLSYNILAEEPFIGLARKGHPALSRRLTTKRFAELDHVMISPRGRVAGAADIALKRVGLHRRVVLVVPTFLAAALAVADSDMVLTCAERSARQACAWLDVQTFQLPIKVTPSSLMMLWHPRTEHSPLQSFVRAQLRKLASASGQKLVPESAPGPAQRRGN